MRRLLNIFGKRPPSAPATDFPVPLDQDPRWRRFMGDNGACPCCGNPMEGLFDIVFHAPVTWPHQDAPKDETGNVRVGEDYLTSDLCQHDDNFFVRCVFPIPVQGSDQTFSFGCWGSLSEGAFRRYLEAEQTGVPFEGAFSWLTNRFPCFDLEDGINEAFACDFIPQDGTRRPHLYAHEGPLADAQENGITFDHLLDIYAATGNDMRPHLVD